MARLIARRDEGAGYVYVASCDGYAVPAECRSVLKRNGAEFSGSTSEWRVPLFRGADVVAALRIDGHQVTTTDADRPRAATTAVECGGCAAPYPAGTDTGLPRPCSVCGADPLVLVGPHECGPQCVANAAVHGHNSNSGRVAA